MRTLPLASNHFPKIPPSNTIHCGLGFQRMIWDWGTNIQTIEWLSHQLSLTSIFTLPLLLLVVVSFSHSVMSHSSQPHGLQYARLPCPLPSLETCSNSCPWSRWCHPTISSSVVPFYSCPQSFPASGSFPVSQFFTSGGQITEASASASVLPMNIQGWFSFRIDWLDLLAVQGTLKIFSSTTVQKHQFFCAQSDVQLISVHDYWKNHSFGYDYIDLCWQSNVSSF